MRWIIDAQLPPALESLLVDRGHRAEHVGTLGMRGASDSLWETEVRDSDPERFTEQDPLEISKIEGR